MSETLEARLREALRSYVNDCTVIHDGLCSRNTGQDCDCGLDVTQAHAEALLAEADERPQAPDLLAALAFYADPDNYEPEIERSLPVNDLLRDHVEPPAVICDAGEIARAAIAKATAAPPAASA